MKCEELPVYKEVWSMVRTMDSYIPNFAREYKYAHGAKLRALGVDLITSICLANHCVSDLSRRAMHLEEALGYFEAYKFTKRLATDAKCLSTKQASVIDERIAKIGAQIKGWKIKSEGK